MKLVASLVACCIAITAASAGIAHAEGLDTPTAAPDRICAQEASHRERSASIPRGLLVAIARTESGRWDVATGRTRAWPWTVTVNGEGKFFPTKAQAVAEVEILMTQGITNIDVGCMQINMGNHWNAFDTVSQVFDPHTNVAYAAKYLRQMRKQTHSWEAAAGRYHSATPGLARRYRTKVMAAWRDIRETEAMANAESAAGTRPVSDEETAALETAGTDTADTDATGTGPASAETTSAQAATTHMAQLAASFRARRAANRATAADASPSELRRKQVELWREARASKADLDRLMAEREAELERKREALLRKASRLDRRVGFARRRRQQLDDWRKHFLTADDS